MVLRLLAAGHEVTVWNRSRDKLAPVLEKGAKAAASPADVARAADIVMMCVTDQKAAEEVLFSSARRDSRRQQGCSSSISPASRRHRPVNFRSRLKAKGIGMIDAPVSGGVPGAEKGTLAIMAGGERRGHRARASGGDAPRAALHAHGRCGRGPGDQAVQPDHRRQPVSGDRRGDPARRGRGRGREAPARGAEGRLRRLAAAADLTARAWRRATSSRRKAPTPSC